MPTTDDTYTATLLDSAAGFMPGTLVQVARGSSVQVKPRGLRADGSVIQPCYVMTVVFPDGQVHRVDTQMFVRGDHAAAVVS